MLEKGVDIRKMYITESKMRAMATDYVVAVQYRKHQPTCLIATIAGQNSSPSR
jgi:hypothetical protein